MGGLGVAPLGAPRLHVARTSMQPRAVVARMVSLTTPIDYTFLNEKVFTGGIEEAKGTKLINVLAAAEYHTAGDLLAANPETFRSSLHNIGVVESYQDTLCNWQTKELQGWFGRIVSLNWLNSKQCIVFVGCAIIYSIGSPIHGLYDIYKPLATRF